jgi:hypothetical protein
LKTRTGSSRFLANGGLKDIFRILFRSSGISSEIQKSLQCNAGLFGIRGSFFGSENERQAGYFAYMDGALTILEVRHYVDYESL